MTRKRKLALIEVSEVCCRLIRRNVLQGYQGSLPADSARTILANGTSNRYNRGIGVHYMV